MAKNLIFDPVGVPAPKALDESAVDLNGALFAACLADQTAAAGSPPTHGLSAFTYGITQEADPSLSLSALSQRVANRLTQLNMAQTPIAIAPPLYPQLLTETFISLREAGSGPSGGSADAGGVDLEAWLRDQLAGVG